MGRKHKTWSLKEVDEARGATRGTAYQAFQQLREGFDEGRDYFYLRNDQDDMELNALRVGGRIYEGSINAVLLTESGYTALMDYLDD